MKNKLERFVNTHRDSFDSELPGNHVWDAVDTTPRTKGKIATFFTRTRVAASFLVLVNAVVIFILLQRRPEHNIAGTPVAPAVEKVETKKEVSSEQTIDQISKVVEIKQAALKEIRSSNPFLYKKFTAAFSQLSITYKSLEKELGTHPNKEELLEAMIQNLSLQQELLNQQLSIYQKIKHQKNEKNNKNI